MFVESPSSPQDACNAGKTSFDEGERRSRTGLNIGALVASIFFAPTSYSFKSIVMTIRHSTGETGDLRSVCVKIRRTLRRLDRRAFLGHTAQYAEAQIASLWGTTFFSIAFHDARDREFTMNLRCLVFAVLAGNFSWSSAALSQSVPASPTNLVAVGSSNRVLLSWSDNSNNESGFRIERSVDDDDDWTLLSHIVPAGVNVYQNTGLSYGRIYYYRVYAFNSSGLSTHYTNQRSATTLRTPSLDSPNDGATVSTSTVTLRWDEVDEAESYSIDLGSSCGSTNILAAQRSDDNSYTLSLSNGTYSWRVQAASFSSPGLSNVSSCDSFTVSVPTRPASPTDLVAVGSANNVLLQWSDNSTNESGFRIERRRDDDDFDDWTLLSQIVPASSGTGTAAYQDTGLSYDHTYAYRVYAYNNAGNSAFYTFERSATVLRSPFLTSPSNGATISASTVTLRWDGVELADLYSIDIGTSCGGTENLNDVAATGTSYTVDLAPGTYYWRVQAVNATAQGVSAPSTCRSFTVESGNPPTAAWTTPPPATVVAGAAFNVTFTTAGSPSHVNIHWDPTNPLASGCCLGSTDSTSSSTLSVTSGTTSLIAPTRNVNGDPLISPTTVRYAVHVSGPGGTGSSAIVAMRVMPPDTDQTVAAPTLTPGTSTFTSFISVAADTTTPGAVIRYTTDGRTPRETPPRSPVWSHSRVFTSDTTLKVRAFKSGMDASEVVAGTYTLAETIPPPRLNYGSAHFLSRISLRIVSTTPPGVVNRYTTDGTPPTSLSLLFPSTLRITAPVTTLRVRAFGTGANQSDITTHSYKRGAPQTTVIIDHPVRGPVSFTVRLLPRDQVRGVIEHGRESWLVIHGRDSSPYDDNNNIQALAEAMDSYPGHANRQVLLADWSTLAAFYRDEAFLNNVPLESAGSALVDLLNEVKLGGSQNLNIVGHSWGAYVGEAIKNRVRANRFVALDPAVWGSGIESANFRTNCNCAWAFIGSALGNRVLAGTADDSFTLVWDLTLLPPILQQPFRHTQTVFVYADLVALGTFGGMFRPDGMIRDNPMWRKNVYNAAGLRGFGGRFEGIIAVGSPNWTATQACFVPPSGFYPPPTCRSASYASGSLLVEATRGACCTGTACTLDVLEADCAGAWRAENSCEGVEASLRPFCCPGNFNRDGVKDAADLFGFLQDWLAASPAAEWNGFEGLDSGDVFAFLTDWFASC